VFQGIPGRVIVRINFLRYLELLDRLRDALRGNQRESQVIVNSSLSRLPLAQSEDNLQGMSPPRISSLCWCLFLLSSLAGFADPVRLDVSAPAFGPGQPIPPDYAYRGANTSPELRIANVPANARSLALIVDDPDAPAGLWTHWLVWNLPPDTASIPAGNPPSSVLQGKNSFGHVRYDGPAPPSGTHRYFFHLYALDTTLDLPAGSDRAALLAAMKGHLVGSGETFGVYQAH
jgi:hypothetical protein